MALSLDTELQVVEPLHVLASLAIGGPPARRRRHRDDHVVPAAARRGAVLLHARARPAGDRPRLRDLPEMAGLAEPGARARFTVISLVDRVSDRPIDSAVQNATAEAATAEIAHRLGCAPGLPVLRIDRLYRDRELRPLELAVNHFHPDRYSYRLQLRARLDRAGLERGAR